MQSLNKIYLAGPITGCSYEDARHGWREEFDEELSGYNIAASLCSPMRGKDNLMGVSSIPGMAHELEGLAEVSKPKGIIGRDFNDVANSDLVVANFLGATRVSIGTAWELGVAFALRKPYIIVLEADKTNLHEHAFLTENAVYRCDNIKTAAKLAAFFLNPGL